MNLSTLELEAGDLFVVEGDATISGLIRYFTKGVASHAGLITDSLGNTIESLSTIKEAHLSNYFGQRMLIVRPINVDDKLKEKAITIIKSKWLGKKYPWWRFVPHLLGQVLVPVKRVNLIGIPVCSELVKYDEHIIGFCEEKEVWGVNPNDLMDEWIMTAKYGIVGRGELNL